MAEALLRLKADGRAVARSAGSRPAPHVHPEVVEVMRELDVDLSQVRPKSLDDADLDGVGIVVTMGCGDECPVVPGARVIDWDITDPSGRPADEVRQIRDEIAARVERLLATL